MAAMKPRTGDGPLEVTKEGRGIVMRVPARGWWPPRRRAERRRGRRPRRSAQGRRRLIVAHTESQTDQLIPPQVSPPEFALSALRPHAIRGVEVVAFPVLPGDDGSVLLGPGAAELGDELGVDLLAAARGRLRDRQDRRGHDVSRCPSELRTTQTSGWSCWSAWVSRRPPTSVGPAPRWPGPAATAPASRRRSRRWPRTAAWRPSSSGPCSGRSRSTCAPLLPSTSPVGQGRAGRAARRHRARRGAVAGPVTRWRQLAGTAAGHRPVQHQEPRLAGRPGGRAREGRRDSRPGSGTSPPSRPTASVASWASARPRTARPA